VHHFGWLQLLPLHFIAAAVRPAKYDQVVGAGPRQPDVDLFSVGPFELPIPDGVGAKGFLHHDPDSSPLVIDGVLQLDVVTGGGLEWAARLLRLLTRDAAAHAIARMPERLRAIGDLHAGVEADDSGCLGDRLGVAADQEWN
jgi:hypothetical protein